jgi:hypothetical protein
VVQERENYNLSGGQHVKCAYLSQSILVSILQRNRTIRMHIIKRGDLLRLAYMMRS